MNNAARQIAVELDFSLFSFDASQGFLPSIKYMSI